MYVIEIEDPVKNWIVALCKEKTDCDDYFHKLSEKMKEKALVYEIFLNEYPVFIIENCSGEEEKYFEFSDVTALNERVELSRRSKKDDEHIYFNYYYLERDYFQLLCDSNFMNHMNHTSVNNEFLDRQTLVSVFEEKIDLAVSDYDIDTLDKLYDETGTQYTSKSKKELLGEGYRRLFWGMNYDYACSKLTEAGIFSLNPIVDKIENLCSDPSIEERCAANQILFEYSIKSSLKDVKGYLKRSVDSYMEYLSTEPSQSDKIYHDMANTYQIAIEGMPEDAFEYWSLAVENILKSIEYNKTSDSWSTFFKLIFIPFDTKVSDGFNKIKEAQYKASEGLEKLLSLHDDGNRDFISAVTKAFNNLRKYLEWYNIDISNFPESMYVSWLNRLEVTISGRSRFELLEDAELFNSEGRRYGRIDLIEKAIYIYKSIKERVEDSVFEIYNWAEALKYISGIHKKSGDNRKADSSLQSAMDLYSENIPLIRNNPSVYIHYAEFAEFCYLYDGNIKGPDITEIEKLAALLEKKERGVISSPTYMRMRLALYRSNEDEAIYHLTKVLIAHELCLDKDIDEMIPKYEGTSFFKFMKFLSDTKEFMEQIRDDYYLDTELNWDEIEKMTRKEIINYWERRKEFLKNRFS